MRKLFIGILVGSAITVGLGCASQPATSPSNPGSGTSSPTPTPAASFTVTPTKTITPTSTNSPTSPMTNTPTPTFTVAWTGTPTLSPTNSPTSTMTSTSTQTSTVTWTGTPTSTPTSTLTPLCPSPSQQGSPYVFTDGILDSGYINSMYFDFSAAGHVGSMEVYAQNGGNHMQAALYYGTSTDPTNLIAQTEVIVDVPGWNILNFSSPVALSAGIYWLAVQTDGNDVPYGNSVGVGEWGYGGSVNMGNFPYTTSWSTFSGPGLGRYLSVYANLCP